MARRIASVSRSAYMMRLASPNRNQASAATKSGPISSCFTSSKKAVFHGRVPAAARALALSDFGSRTMARIADGTDWAVNVFVVDSLADTDDTFPADTVCSDAGGKCTLRAAIQEANALLGADVIRLPAGTYVISRQGADEDHGATGDLDITSSLSIARFCPQYWQVTLISSMLSASSMSRAEPSNRRVRKSVRRP